MKQYIPLIFQKRHILPGGKIPLRISPGPQMEAFKAALKNENGFGVCMFDEGEHGHHFFHIGTRVTVEDFDTSTNDGTLVVTVAGHENFRIDSLERNDDGVFIGDCQPIPLWPETKVSSDQQVLADKLKIMFKKHPELNGLHQEKQFSNLSWLCQRWLELLPVPASEKQALLNTPNCYDTYDYLMSIMQKNH
ncbi:Lon protease [Photobacterium sanctipauli]|uniref:Lon protease n=1 Tax=Photobacterium sanctipauli TaxID=1342794 RepID=A0A2T3NY12_9GAMM|nr:LON peptidase substrate-binding domain-containing protein [Photobacterium sanctipauli]PSW21079.1 Lon protease [Photobacterium sanctipauli]